MQHSDGACRLACLPHGLRKGLRLWRTENLQRNHSGLLRPERALHIASLSLQVHPDLALGDSEEPQDAKRVVGGAGRGRWKLLRASRATSEDGEGEEDRRLCEGSASVGGRKDQGREGDGGRGERASERARSIDLRGRERCRIPARQNLSAKALLDLRAHKGSRSLQVRQRPATRTHKRATDNIREQQQQRGCIASQLPARPEEESTEGGRDGQGTEEEKRAVLRGRGG
eukprot:2331767-Rhodomonas_salina.1